VENEFSVEKFSGFLLTMHFPPDNFTDMLALLQHQAQAHSDAVAYVLPNRVITYRRFWSRIERACARLQGEWGVRQGDVVAYVGSGHPDALILYFALLRLDASLLPLEALATEVVHTALISQPVSLLLHDEGMTYDTAKAQPLQRLLEDWCHYEPLCVEEVSSNARLLLRTDNDELQSLTIDNLLSAMASQARSLYVGEQIFSLDILTSVIFPALHAARELTFSATDTAVTRQRTGS
jgi:acyl-CoA synthetase (AMP-forming)/AMP-acid ligase II